MSGRPFVATHGKTDTPEYRTWCTMKSRCTNPNFHKYPDYGGRGIKICERWLHSFESFLADMGPKPSPRHTIDRKDNDGDYCPENCRWATPAEQNRNRTIARIITFGGETLTLAEWAKRLGIGYTGLRRRLGEGWPLEKALSAPPVAGRKKFTDEQVREIRRRYKAGGISQEELGHAYGVTQGTIRDIVSGASYPQVA